MSIHYLPKGSPRGARMAENKNALPARDEIDPKYKWKLEDIYANDADWENDFRKIRQMSLE